MKLYENQLKPDDRNLKGKAKKIKKASILLKVSSIILVSLILIAGITYLISYFYERYSSFTVSISKYDMVKQSLSLSETPIFETPISRLNAGSLEDCTNISGDNLPLNINQINGRHNGSNYIAYTFFVKNTGLDTLSYKYRIFISNVTRDVDEAIRIRLYRGDEYETFAKTKRDGSGAENFTSEFLTLSTVTEKTRRSFNPGDIDKFTVVIWLEGDDPDCVDDIIGGKIKADMNISISESS